MSGRVAIVTGGLRGLGRAMTLGLAGSGESVVAIGHIAGDVAGLEAELAGTPLAERVHAMAADLRRPVECDRVVATARERFGGLHILVNNAGLTFTYFSPDRFRRTTPFKFWEATDEMVQNVMDTNYVAADQMARRVAPLLIKQGWGRILNVTTKLDTMNRAGSSPYGPSKAALEMASEIWAKEVAGTGLTVNVLNPGAGANTPGMAQEMRDANRAGRIAGRLLEPEEMVPPLLFLVSSEADGINGFRFDAITWDGGLPAAEAARRNGMPAGLRTHDAAPGG